MVEGGIMADTVMKEMKEHEAAAKVAHDAQSTQRADAKQNLDALSKALEKIEAQTLSGAASLTPKELMLDLSDLKEKHPDKHFRWVNIKAPEVADRRRLNGYIRLPESEGGRELGGELAVFVTTAKIHESHVAKLKQMREDRLRAHQADVEKVAESVVRELRDKYGIKVDLNRILVNEE